jgi:hypothetical protein
MQHIPTHIPASASALAKLAVAVSLLVLASPGRARAEQAAGNLGLGVVAGLPSGVSGKLWLGPANALDFIVGLGLVGYEHISVNVDYVWHEWDLIPVRRGRLPLYYGMGVWTRVSNNPYVGGRGVVGLEYLFPSAPLDIFLEIGPGISVLPETDVAFSAGLGMRYFF